MTLLPAPVTLGALSGVSWSVAIAAGLISTAAVIGALLLSRPTVQQSRSPSETLMADSKTPRRPEPAALASSLLPPVRVKKKKKKTVRFDLDRNETVEVGDWYIQTWGIGKKYWGVRWGLWVVDTFEPYLEPDGHNQLHFPRTKWIRDVPSWDEENDDGDIEMIDV